MSENIDIKDLANRTLRWSLVLGCGVVPVSSPEEIGDGALREAISRRKGVTGWVDRRTGEVNVFLPSVKTREELDAVVLRHAVTEHGIGVLFSDVKYMGLCQSVWGSMYPDQRKQYLKLVDGDASSTVSQRQAAEAFLLESAELLNRVKPPYYSRLRKLAASISPEEKRKITSRWYHVSQKVQGWFTDHSGLGALQDIPFMDILGEAVREHIMARRAERINPATLKEDLKTHLWQAARMYSDTELMSKSYLSSKPIPLGLPNGTYLGCSELAANRRFYATYWSLLGENGDKQDRHPFDITKFNDLMDLMNRPLAIFRSVSAKKQDNLVIVLPKTLKGGSMPENGTFVVPVVPSDYHSGKVCQEHKLMAINFCQSLYAKKNINLLRTLSRKKAVCYIDPELSRKWLESLRKEVEEYYAPLLKSEKKCSGPSSRSNSDKVATTTLKSIREEYDKVTRLLDDVTKVANTFENCKPLDENYVLFNENPARQLLIMETSDGSTSIDMTFDERRKMIADEYRNALKAAAKNGSPGVVLTPRLTSGASFSGGAGVHLRLLLKANTSWPPVFLKLQDMIDYGLEKKTEGHSCAYLDKKDGRYYRYSVWNLAETDFAEKHPEYYKEIQRIYAECNTQKVADVSGFTDYPGNDRIVDSLARFDMGNTCGDGAANKIIFDEFPELATLVDSMSDKKVYSLFEKAGRHSFKELSSKGLFVEKHESLEQIIDKAERRFASRTVKEVRPKIENNNLKK